MASRVLDVLDDDLLNVPESMAGEPPVQEDAVDEPVPAHEVTVSPEVEETPAAMDAEVPPPAAAEEVVEREEEGKAAEEVEQVEEAVAPPPSESRRSRKFKPKGMYLGRRRDTGEPVDIKPTVLARHAAMLGSTGSGKTVMAKVIDEKKVVVIAKNS